MKEIVKTNIDGLLIKINKVITDNRGFLTELSPTGADNEFFKNGIKNIYSSTATGKYIARAGHLHYKNVENFYTLSGTALWLFVDCRKDSKTFNETFFVILGSKSPNFGTTDPMYLIDQSKMAHILVPTGVYHLFWPLTEDPVIVLAIASEPYDKTDYEKIDLKSFPFVQEKLNKYGIVIE